MSRALERVLEEVRNLTAEERRQLAATLDAPAAAVGERSQEIVDHVYGKYAHVPTSAQDFCARKADEISLEGRNHRE